MDATTKREAFKTAVGRILNAIGELKDELGLDYTAGPHGSAIALIREQAHAVRKQIESEEREQLEQDQRP